MVYEWILNLKVISEEQSETMELAEFITDVMNMELEKWGVTFELLGAEKIK